MRTIERSILISLFAAALAACSAEPAKTEEPAAEPVADAGIQTTPTEGDTTEETPTAAESAAEDETERAPQTHAVVAAVLPPAWIYRGEQSTALLPGAMIYEGDRVETGADGRVQLTLDDGASLQLGGNGSLVVERSLATDTGSLDGALSVVKGGLAFQSGGKGKLLPGDLEIKAGKLAAAFTHASLLASSSNGGTICLMSGEADITGAEAAADSEGSDTATGCMTGAGAAEDSARTQKSLQSQVQPPAGVAAMKNKGTWSLVFVSEAAEKNAKLVARKLWKSGYPAEVIEAKVKGKTYFRVALRGFESREAAKTMKDRRAAALGYKNAWVVGK